MTSEKENFDNLIRKALKEWPDQIIFGRLHFNQSGGFSVEGLGDISSALNEKYIDHKQEVIWRNMHDAIYIVLHDSAKYLKSISMSNVRLDEVKKIFERRLIIDLEHADHRWRENDYKSIYDYFKAEGRPLDQALPDT